MSDNVTKFPEPETRPPLLVGPFEEWRVMIDGRVIPKLTGFKRTDGSVSLCVDHRFGADFPDEDVAHQAAYLIANAMAIGAGYPWCGAESKDQPFAAKGVCLAEIPK